MLRNLLLLFFCLCSVFVEAQELNATVTIDAEQTGQPNAQVFRTLKDQLTELLNETQWTNRTFTNQERIDCNFTLILQGFESTSFSGSLQVQSSRTVFGSTYDSPVYNYNDRQFVFEYSEFQPLVFNINNFDSNLVSVLAYHVYTIIGLDADTFAPFGGDPYFAQARQIVNTAASSSFQGWKAVDGTQSRYRFNDAVLSNVYQDFRQVMYDYHRTGLDLMSTNLKNGKTGVRDAVILLKKVNDRRPNSFLMRTFFDAKANEIQQIFSDGPTIEITELVEVVKRIAPTKSDSWNKIKL
ncbi:MAG: DUF4835 family protein [Flavobacteriaceae bacterium]|nr:DUF4835 family protein [Flavobacteriaceae bacterium]